MQPPLPIGSEVAQNMKARIDQDRVWSCNEDCRPVWERCGHHIAIWPRLAGRPGIHCTLASFPAVVMARQANCARRCLANGGL